MFVAACSPTFLNRCTLLMLSVARVVLIVSTSYYFVVFSTKISFNKDWNDLGFLVFRNSFWKLSYCTVAIKCSQCLFELHVPIRFYLLSTSWLIERKINFDFWYISLPYNHDQRRFHNMRQMEVIECLWKLLAFFNCCCDDPSARILGYAFRNVPFSTPQNMKSGLAAHPYWSWASLKFIALFEGSNHGPLA